MFLDRQNENKYLLYCIFWKYLFHLNCIKEIKRNQLGRNSNIFF